VLSKNPIRVHGANRLWQNPSKPDFQGIGKLALPGDIWMGRIEGFLTPDPHRFLVNPDRGIRVYKTLIGVARGIVPRPAVALCRNVQQGIDQNGAPLDLPPDGYKSSGGNPDGYIKATDKGYGSTWYFVSPSLGDMSSYKGGTLSYDIKFISRSGSYFDNDEVIIKNGSSSMSWAPAAVHQPALNTWTTYSVDLTSANFVVSSGTFDGILSNVTVLWIRGEYVSGGDSEGLDNVKLPPAPVPLPLPILFLGSGLAGLAALRGRIIKQA